MGVFTAVLVVAAPEVATPQETIHVQPPTGDPEIDWLNIQSALDSAQPGDTLQLQAGHYRIHRMLLRQPWSGAMWGYGPPFDATIQGMGMNVTIVEAVRASEAVGFEAPGFYSQRPSILEVDLLEKLTLRDLALQVVQQNICDEYVNIWGTTTQSLFALARAVEGDRFDTLVGRVRMSGAPSVPGDEAGPYNTGFLWQAIGNFSNWDSSGNHLILDSEFENCSWDGVGVEQLTDSSTYIDNITVRNAANFGLVIGRQRSPRAASLSNCLFEGEGDYAVSVFHAPNVAITGNTFRDFNGADGAIILIDAPNTAIIENTFKDFNGSGMFWTSLLDIFYGNHDCVIRRNAFINVSGVSTAVLVEGRGGWEGNHDNIFLDNDYRESGLPGWQLGSGSVFLGESTGGNFVIERHFPRGTDMCDQILDFGENAIPGWQGVCKILPQAER